MKMKKAIEEYLEELKREASEADQLAKYGPHARPGDFQWYSSRASTLNQVIYRLMKIVDG